MGNLVSYLPTIKSPIPNTIRPLINPILDASGFKASGLATPDVWSEILSSAVILPAIPANKKMAEIHPFCKAN